MYTYVIKVEVEQCTFTLGTHLSVMPLRIDAERTEGVKKVWVKVQSRKLPCAIVGCMLINNHKLHQLIYMSTRLTSQSATLLHIIVTNQPLIKHSNQI